MSTVVRTVLGSAALLLTASIGLAAPASAQTTAVSPNSTSQTTPDAAFDRPAAVCMPDFREPGTRIRSAPSLGAPILGIGNPGDCLQAGSYVEGDLVQCESGTQTTHWRHITNLRTGVAGWVSACLWP